jgi:hypothetical protein
MIHKVNDLLPFHPNSLLKKSGEKLKILLLCQYVYRLIGQATAAFLDSALSRFDAHVGETCCHVRVFYLYCLAIKHQTPLADLAFRKEILALKEKATVLDNLVSEFTHAIRYRQSHYDKQLDSKTTLCELLESYELNVPLSETVVFLATAYFLTQYAIRDADGFPNEIDVDAVSQTLTLSKTTAKKLVDHLQKILASLSCQYLLSSLASLNDFHREKALVPQMYRKDSAGRGVVPIYEGMKILLASSLPYEPLILLKVTRMLPQGRQVLTLLFRFNPHGQDTLLDCRLYKNHACITIHGICEQATEEALVDYARRLQEIGLERLLLINMAYHPQWADITHNPYAMLRHLITHQTGISCENPSTLSDIDNLESNYQYMCELAQQLGACKERPYLFRMQHVYCSKVGDVMVDDYQFHLGKQSNDNNNFVNQKELII